MGIENTTGITGGMAERADWGGKQEEPNESNESDDSDLRVVFIQNPFVGCLD